MTTNEVITFIKKLYNADSVQLHAPVFIGNERNILRNDHIQEIGYPIDAVVILQWVVAWN